MGGSPGPRGAGAGGAERKRRTVGENVRLAPKVLDGGRGSGGSVGGDLPGDVESQGSKTSTSDCGRRFSAQFLACARPTLTQGHRAGADQAGAHRLGDRGRDDRLIVVRGCDGPVHYSRSLVRGPVSSPRRSSHDYRHGRRHYHPLQSPATFWRLSRPGGDSRSHPALQRLRRRRRRRGAGARPPSRR